MPRYHVSGEAKNKNSAGKIGLNFEITANSYAEAKDKARAEAKKKHPAYDILSVYVEQK